MLLVSMVSRCIELMGRALGCDSDLSQTVLNEEVVFVSCIVRGASYS